MRRPGNNPCQTVLHTLKFQDVLESNIMMKGNTIVKSTANKSSCVRVRVRVRVRVCVSISWVEFPRWLVL